jgi:hypothetical protein
MTDLENKVDRWDHDHLQQQVWVLNGQIEKLTEIIKTLQLQIQALQLNSFPNDSFDYQNYKTKCSKCGMTFDGITSYYCSNNDCPIFLKVR